MTQSANFTQFNSVIFNDGTNIFNIPVTKTGNTINYPDGDIGGKLKAWVDAGNTITDYAAPAPTVDDVVKERERRLALGFDYTFSDARGKIHIHTSAADMIGWDDVTKVTQAMIGLGAGTTTIQIQPENTEITITAYEWQQILLAAAQFRQPLWFASFVLQAMTPIPADYKNDSYWL